MSGKLSPHRGELRAQGRPAVSAPGRARRKAKAPSKGTASSSGGKGGGKSGGRARSAGAGRRRRQTARSGGLGRWIRRLVVWGLIAVIWGGVALAGVVAYFAYDLPKVESIADIQRRPSVQLVSSEGEALASFGDLYGEAVWIGDLPPHLPRAVIAVEDRRFYAHPGVDPIGLTRALVANLRAGRVVQGGSTLTQQLAKNLFLTPERTIERKVQEALLALWLEQKFSKDQILSLYLNRVYFGSGTYGVDAAARRYFGKPARELGLYESAMLAGLLKAPSRYNPARDADLAHTRTTLVLTSMVRAGYLSLEQAQEAADKRARGRVALASHNRYFADWVLAQVEGYVGKLTHDVVVTTTLDPKLQSIAEEEVRRVMLAAGPERAASQAAAVVLAPDGAIKAMVGGLDYGQSQFNRAAQALRQPGSAFKLFVYLAGVEEGLTPDSRWTDGPVAISTATGPWTPRNYGGRYYGEVTLREAFARSLNSVAVQVAQGVGPKKVAAAAKRLGITTPLEATPSLALGASEVTLLELTGAYATLANGGNGVFPFGIQRIVSREGVMLYDRSGAGPGRLVSPRDLGRMNDMLQATVGWGTGRRADPGRPAAGKTGTSQDFRDAWFLGFTADLVAGVWVGNDDGKPMKEVTGGSLPADIWKGVMVRALDGVPPRSLQGPAPGPADDAASGDFLSNLFDRLIGGGSDGGSAGASNPQRGSSDPAAPAAGGRLPPAGSDR